MKICLGIPAEKFNTELSKLFSRSPVVTAPLTTAAAVAKLRAVTCVAAHVHRFVKHAGKDPSAL